MPGEDIQSWSVTAASNGSSDTGINWLEGQARASVNNSARAMMAAHAKQRNLLNGSIVTGGTGDAVTFTSGLNYTTVPTGLRVLLKFSAVNTGPATLNMDGIGDVAISTGAGAALIAEQLVAGALIELVYNGTNWVLLDYPVGGTIHTTSIITTGDIISNGNISAVDGTFSGDISAVDGTFSGNVTADGFVRGNSFVYSRASAGSPAFFILSDPDDINKGMFFWNQTNNDVSIQNNTARAAGFQDLVLNQSGRVGLGNGFLGRSGYSGVYQASSINFYHDGTGMFGYLDDLNFGYVAFSSDYRIKKDVAGLPTMWNTVKALRPIKYTQAAYAAFHADNIERWGFIAHELQATLTPSAATGVKDAANLIQSPNPFTLIAALTKALQEAMARIEVLEAKP